MKVHFGPQLPRRNHVDVVANALNLSQSAEVANRVSGVGARMNCLVAVAPSVDTGRATSSDTPNQQVLDVLSGEEEEESDGYNTRQEIWSESRNALQDNLNAAAQYWEVVEDPQASNH